MIVCSTSWASRVHILYSSAWEVYCSRLYRGGLCRCSTSDWSAYVCLLSLFPHSQILLPALLLGFHESDRKNTADRRVIRDDEQTHLTTLQSIATTLGGSTADLNSCQFDFSAALGDVTSFLATARVLEFVGVDAWVPQYMLSRAV